ncbi:hypothetical protein [Altererythrobacter sp.]|uniref:hypothetical protein n=1 Tax=Altererythrobacter sp. TaxID=1872480 RepID=UPI003D057D90
MSRQLTISSAFAVLAMAAMVLTSTPDRSGMGASDEFTPLQAEMPSFDLPRPSFIR